MGESKLGRVGNGFAQWRAPSDFNRSPRQAKFCENHWRRVRGVRNSVRVEHSCSIKAPEEHLSIPILETRPPSGQIRTRQTFRSRVALDRCALWIESRYSMIGTHPKAAVVIFENAAHCIAREAVSLRIDGERAGLRVKLVQPVLGAYPQSARAIKVHRVHPVVAQSFGTIHVVFVPGE